jgi:hypothetical protein
MKMMPDMPLKKAIPADIQGEYLAVKALNGSSGSEKQAAHTKLVIDNNAIDDLYFKKMKGFEDDLAKRIYPQHWRAFPNSAKMALLSIYFGVGNPQLGNL